MACMMNRNLLAEQLANKKRRVDTEEVDEVPTTPEPELTFELFEEIAAIVDAAEFNPLKDACIVVHVTDKLADEVVAAGDEGDAEALMAAQGVFFATQVLYESKMIWKSVEPNIAGHHMLFWPKDNGWFCSSQMFFNDKHQAKFHPLISMWCNANPIAELSDLPGTAHFPFWKKAKTDEIIVDTLFNSLMKANADIAFHTMGVEDTLIEKPSAGSSDDHKDKDKGKGKGKKGQHGGWIPRVAQLIVAIYKKDWAYAETLANRFYYGWPGLKKVVDMKLRY